MINFSKTTWLIIFFIIFIILAGFFAYQWWQVKGELGRKIEENENLTKEIENLQGEIEELKISKEETAEWKTYRNEEYGFEIDYPVGWEFDEASRTLCKSRIIQEDKEKFCIKIAFERLDDRCQDVSFAEILANPNIEAGGCLSRSSLYGGEIEKEILTKFGIKGYKAKVPWPTYGWDKWYDECPELKVGYFVSNKKNVINKEIGYFPVIGFYYYDCPKYIDFEKDEIEIFEEVLSTFRFIRK